jgi:hypothetical protein
MPPTLALVGIHHRHVGLNVQTNNLCGLDLTVPPTSSLVGTHHRHIVSGVVLRYNALGSVSHKGRACEEFCGSTSS